MLLLWLTCCAVYFGLARQFLMGRTPQGVSQWLLWITISAWAGLCWAMVLNILARWLQSNPTAVQPGEWILFCMGIVLALDFVVRWLPRTSPLRPEVIMAAGICSVLLIPTLSRHLSTTWKLFFMLLVGVYAIPLIVLLLSYLGRWPWPDWTPPQALEIWKSSSRIVVLLAVAATLVWEYRSGRYTTWWNALWIAIATLIWTVV